MASIHILDIEKLSDLDALRAFCRQLEEARGAGNDDEHLTRVLPVRVVEWLMAAAPRCKAMHVDFAEIKFRVCSTGEYDDKDRPYLTLHVVEEYSTGDIAGIVEGAVQP